MEGGRRARFGSVLEMRKAFPDGQMWSVETKEDSRVWGLTDLGGWRDRCHFLK